MTMAESGFRIAERVTEERARSFHLAAHVLGREQRQAAYVLYNIFQRCEDALKIASPEVRDVRLAALEGDLGRLFGVERSKDPVLESYREVIHRFGIPENAVRGLVRGIREDLEEPAYQTWEELERHCDLVSGTVSRSMAAILGADRAAVEHAAAMGQAMRLTKILRDVKDDLLQRGRVYLPMEGLRHHGFDRSDLLHWSRVGKLRGDRAERFRSFARELMARAEAFYEDGDDGFRSISDSRARLVAILMRATYSEILRLIEERKFDVFAHRIRPSAMRKVRAIVRSVVERPPLVG